MTTILESTQAETLAAATVSPSETRQVWERPELRRLTAVDAEAKSNLNSDGPASALS